MTWLLSDVRHREEKNTEQKKKKKARKIEVVRATEISP